MNFYKLLKIEEILFRNNIKNFHLIVTPFSDH